MEPLSGLGLRKKEQKPELNQTFPTLVDSYCLAKTRTQVLQVDGP